MHPVAPAGGHAAAVVMTSARRAQRFYRHGAVVTARTMDDQIRTERLIHDIRSPLSAIRGYAQLPQRRLANDGAKAVGVDDRLRRILESPARVGQLVDQLGESSAPETTSAVKREPTELVQLARRMAAESEAAAGGRGHVEVLPAVADLVGWWDRGRLERMLANLVGNALKYNRKGRPIAVIVQRDGDSAVLSVADRGVGTPPAELQRVFDRGYRGSNVGSRSDGWSLDLASAQDAVTEHGGAIHLQSQESVGTTVTVRLPLGDAATGTLTRGSLACGASAACGPRHANHDGWFPDNPASDSGDHDSHPRVTEVFRR